MDKDGTKELLEVFPGELTDEELLEPEQECVVEEARKRKS
jgi:hypothetical protein